MSAWRWVAPAPIEAAHVLWVTTEEGREPNSFTFLLISAIYAAPEPDLLRLATYYPGLATAVVCAKDGDLDKLREAAGDYVRA